MKSSPEELRKRLVLTFAGEEAVDEEVLDDDEVPRWATRGGAMSREFFYLLSQSIVEPSRGLVDICSKGLCTLQFIPGSEVTPDRLGYFRFVGRVVGVVIFSPSRPVRRLRFLHLQARAGKACRASRLGPRRCRSPRVSHMDHGERRLRRRPRAHLYGQIFQLWHLRGL